MFALVHRKTRNMLTISGRGILAVVMIIIALANMITVVIESPWNNIVVTEPLIDLGGPVWERDGFIVIGVLLLLVARALIRGKRQAWWLSVGLLVFSLASALVSRSDRSTILLALSLLALLLLLAPLFPTRSDRRASIQGYLALVAGIGFVTTHLVLSQLWQVTGGQASLTLHHAVLFLLHLLAFPILGYGVVQVLHPVRAVRTRVRQDYARVYETIRRYGSLATVHFALGRDKSYFWSKTGHSVIAYRVVHGVALALGDPIGPQEEHASILQAFLAFCQRQDWSVALYQTSERVRQLCLDWGMHAYKIGEEAFIDIAHFTLQGKRGAPVRHAVARARREGLSTQCWQGEAIPQAVFAGMQQVSTEWLATRNAQAQMGFSMGRFPNDWSEALLTIVAFDSQGQVTAFLTCTPLYAGNGWALDAMRRGKRTPPGAMELLIAHAIEWAQARGYTRMSLGLAPLASSGREAPATPGDALEGGLCAPSSSLLERCATSLHRRGIVLGGYRSLYAFKAKFQPTWEARYLVVSEGKLLPRILLALARVHSSGWWSLFPKAWNSIYPVNKLQKAIARLLRAKASGRGSYEQ
jgi:phosphatidylglycerol lysyltransferase